MVLGGRLCRFGCFCHRVPEDSDEKSVLISDSKILSSDSNVRSPFFFSFPRHKYVGSVSNISLLLQPLFRGYSGKTKRHTGNIGGGYWTEKNQW